MRYGKNQQALLDFLYKHPNKFHLIRRKKAINAAKGLQHRLFGIIKTIRVKKSKWFYVSLDLPQMLTVQN